FDQWFLRRPAGLGFLLGNARNRRQDLLAHILLIAAHGQSHFGLVGDDIVLRSRMNVATVTTAISPGFTSRETIVCKVRIVRAAITIGSIAVCGADPWPPLP